MLMQWRQSLGSCQQEHHIWIKCGGDKICVVDDTMNENDTNSFDVSQTDELWFTWIFVDE